MKPAEEKPPVEKTEQGQKRPGEAPEVAAKWLARPVGYA